MTTQTSAVHIPVWTRGDRFRKAREETGLTQQEFADELGVARQTISAYEADERSRPMKSIVRAWAMRCGVPVEWLNGAGDEPTLGGAGLPRRDSNAQPAGYTFLRAIDPGFTFRQPIAPASQAA